MGLSDGTVAVSVRAVGADQRAVVKRLAQLERYDLSEYRGLVPGSDGMFAFPALASYFSEPDRHAHLILHGSTPAGFALTRGTSDGGTSVSAFFVIRALRRRGVGHRAALELLRLYPGRWGIGFQEDREGVRRFWERVATAAAGSEWREEQRPAHAPALPPDTWLLLDTLAAGASGDGAARLDSGAGQA